ncbi:MAG: AAA family ATPase [Desulfobacterales bacterium]
MILQSIALSGWRCFLDEITVGPFSDRLNVISGPNGIGKSTLFEALRRVLMDSYSVTGQDIGTIRPWGRALSPRVSVTFKHDDTRYKVTKQFLDSSFARLERKEDGVYRPLAEGRQADEQVRELLSKNPPGRGLSQARNWGLAQVLWAPQGGLELIDLSGDVVSDIRTVLGIQVSDKSSGPLERKLFEIHERYYTRQGRVKSGRGAPPIVDLNESLNQSEQRRKEALEALQRCEEISRKVEELGARHHQLSLDADELTQSIKNNRARADQYRRLKTDCKNRKNDVEKTEAQHQRLKQHLDLIRSAEKEFKENKGELARLETEMPLKHHEVETREEEATEAKKRLNTVRKGDDIVAKAETDADMARQYREISQRRTELTKRIQNIETADKNLNERKKKRSEWVAPDRKALNRIRKTVQARDEARLLMDSAMISLEITTETDGILNVYTGESPGQVSITTGKAALVKGTPEIIAELKGVARLHASGPVMDIEKHRQTLRDKEKQIGEQTRPFGTEDMILLEERTEKAEHLDRQIGEAAKELEALLGEDTLDGLKQDIVHLDAQLMGIEKEHPGWKDSAPDSEALKRTAADLKQEHARKVSAEETTWDNAQKALSSAKEQEQILIGRVADARKAVRRLETRLSDLTSDGKTTQENEAELNRLLLDYDACKAALKDLEDRLDCFEDDPEMILEKLEKSLTAVQESVQNIRDEERRAMGTLETLTAQGPYSILVKADEEVARIEEEIKRESLRMDAIKLLYDTVQQCKSEAVASVAKPVEETATRLLQRIAGRRIGQIAIGENFGPSGTRPELVDSQVELSNLSGGEQEQLYLATRLALAEVLAKNERQMVVLDDVLTATDIGRLARVMTILEESAEYLQILILTCHPERYKALAGAEFFDLESLLKM